MWEGFSHYYLVSSPLSSSPRQPTWASWTTGNRKWKTWASTPATALSTLESLWQIWTSGRSRRSPKSWRSGWRRISGKLLNWCQMLPMWTVDLVYESLILFYLERGQRSNATYFRSLYGTVYTSTMHSKPVRITVVGYKGFVSGFHQQNVIKLTLKSHTLLPTWLTCSYICQLIKSVFVDLNLLLQMFLQFCI